MTGPESSLRFGADAGARRSEDGPLLTGRGRFTDDIDLPGQAHACFVRSPLAHAVIRGVDPRAALAMPGVLAVLTGRDLEAAGLGRIPPAAAFPGRGGKPLVSAPIPPLAVDRVHYVGEAVAIAVAETPALAADAAAGVRVDLDPLPAAADVERALAPGAHPVHPAAPDNVAFDWTDGDAAAVDAAIRGAAHVARVRLHDTRLAPSALEPRAAIGQWDAATDRYTLTASTQGVAVVRRLLAEGVFRIPPQKLRVVTHDVGGGFGMKVQAYPEYAALLFAARRVGRPVKWRATRVESFLADTHGRDGILEGELALDAAGRFLALRVRTRVGLGAYVSAFAAVFGTNNTKNCLSSVYTIPAIAIDVALAFTNAAPLGPYRGAGRPEALYLIERLIDQAATALGIDRVALRRRNLIAPAAMPYRAPNGMVYDSGEFETVMDQALALADWKGFPARRVASERAGRLRGIGLCCFLEVAGGILDETVDLRFGADGTVALHTGAQAMGQGHLSTFPLLIAARLGVDPGAVRLVQGDSDLVPAGTPSVASRSMMMAGSAAAQACDASIEKGRRVAAHYFEAAAPDVEFAAGRFRVRGTDRAIGLLELAGRARTLPGLPDDLGGGLDSTAKFVSPQMTFPNGCHVAEVEIDPETGAVAVVGYAAVDDVGRLVHETIVEGQIHGGIAQGLGQVLGEHVVYDEHGQLLTASFMDYMLPRADDVPALRVGHHGVLCTTNPLGVKGAGESGVAGALPAAVNAVLDALATRGVRDLDLPMSAARIWNALHS
ncbi:MAG TPA: xanthine dehydrogenase family protein molybdopterin-binding subunit [Candidatus Dormibacteraeota bacterium]|nr:xanthine dehydrogenase family protein molybdopterin-binding subunit [Candidatus Dormibacteraeota bacterium]